MSDYSSYKRFILFIIVFYFAAGLATRLLPGSREKDIIPFYSWFLFDRVPNGQRSYEIRIRKQNGKTISPPVLFENADGIVAEPKSPKARLITKTMGENSERRDEAGLEQLRKQFEQAFLVASASYDLVITTYDPVARFKGEKPDIRVVKEFNFQ